MSEWNLHEVRCWDGEEDLHEQTLYVVRQDDAELFNEVCNVRIIPAITYSRSLPGGRDAAAAYASLTLGLKAVGEDSRTVGLITLVRQISAAVEAVDGGRLTALYKLGSARYMAEGMGLRRAPEMLNSLCKLIGAIQALWRESLLTPWRALINRDAYDWAPAIAIREQVDEALVEVDRLQKGGINLTRLRRQLVELSKVTSKWNQLELEDRYYFASWYMLMAAVWENRRGNGTLAHVLAHRSLDWLFLGYAVENSLVRFDESARRFYYKDGRKDEASVLSGAHRIFPPGSKAIRVARNVNNGRNSCLLAHGVDDIATEEAGQAIEFVERCISQLGVKRICASTSVVTGGICISLSPRELLEFEEDYDVYFEWNPPRDVLISSITSDDNN